jgi:hypothetical protein
MANTPDFNKIEKLFKESMNTNATQDSAYHNLKTTIENSTRDKNGWLDIFKLDTEKGKVKAYNESIKALTDTKINPLYAGVKGRSKQITEQIGLRTIGLNLTQLKGLIDSRGKDAINIVENLKENDIASQYKREMLQLPFNTLKESNIDDIINYTVPQNITLDKKPSKLDEAISMLIQKYNTGGQLGQGQLKQMGYIK